MHAIFSRRVVVAGSSSQLTKPVKRKTSQSRHFLSHLLPYGLSSSSSSATRFVHSVVPRSEKIHGFFASTLGNTQLKQKFGNVFESRVRFFSSELPPSYGFESKGFAGFQKRGWPGQRVVPKDQVKVPIMQQGADGSVFAITLLDMFLYPKVTTYFGLMLRMPVMAGTLTLGLGMLKLLEGKKNNISSSSSQLGGVVIAVIAWARIRKGRFCN